MSNDADRRETVEYAAPLGWFGDAADIAGVAISLASRAGANLTGVVIPVDGGATDARRSDDATYPKRFGVKSFS